MVEIPSFETAPAQDVSKPLERTVKIGTEFAHIHASSEALRANLIAEAVKQGISEDVATSYAEKAKFSVGSSRDLLAQIANEEQSTRKALSYRLSSVLSPSSAILGTVLEKDKTHYCHVAAELIVHEASRKYAQYPQEVQEAAVLQELDAVWRHERQHMIQNMEPAKKAAKEKTHTAHKAITITLLGVNTAIAECALLEPDLIMTHKELPIIAAISGAAMIGDVLYRRKLSRPEREAHRMGKPEHYTRNSPFQVSFESNSADL